MLVSEASLISLLGKEHDDLLPWGSLQFWLSGRRRSPDLLFQG